MQRGEMKVKAMLKVAGNDNEAGKFPGVTKTSATISFRLVFNCSLAFFPNLTNLSACDHGSSRNVSQ